MRMSKTFGDSRMQAIIFLHAFLGWHLAAMNKKCLARGQEDASQELRKLSEFPAEESKRRGLVHRVEVGRMGHSLTRRSSSLP